jgi:radical SAM protein with 4Fe4S-binding SPASM domain
MKRIELEAHTDLKSEIPLNTPYCIFIDPSNACNFKCKFCMNQKIKHTDVMEFSLFKKIIDDIQEFENPVKTIKLYGFGEPLINKNFCDMVKYIKKSGRVLKVNTTTNASLLTPELNTKLIDSGIDRINISIEAIGTKNYIEFTGNKNVKYEKIVENICDLYSRKQNMTIFIKINGDYLNNSEKEEFINTFAPISDGHEIEHTMNCWRDFKVDNVNAEVGIYGQELHEVQVCPYIFYNMFIHSDGYVSACFLDWNKKLVLGDVKNESVKKLWNDKLLKHLQLEMLRKNRKNHPICNNCSQLTYGMPVDLDNHAETILKTINKGNI